MQKLVDPDHALALVLEAAAARATASIERLAAERALHRVLARDVSADRDFPPFDRAMMDGYAVCVVDAGAEVAVVGEVRAGQAPATAVTPGSAVAVMTGAPCPPGTEAVVMREHVESADPSDASPPGRVLLPGAERLRRGQHVAPRGSDAAAGRVVLEAGTVLTPGGLAILAAVGRAEVAVRALPSMAVIATGDELVATEGLPAAEQIRDSNGPMIASLARFVGLQQVRSLRAVDTPGGLAAALGEVGDVDVVVLSGGVSMGRYDLVPEALAAVGAEAVFHKATQKPGKPLLLATRDQQLYFGLPGNPVSSHFCFHRYVAPALRRLQGLPPVTPPALGRLVAPLRVGSWRTVFVQARVEVGEQGLPLITPLLGTGSADLFAGGRANAYLRLEPGEHELAAGTEVRFEWICGVMVYP